MILDETAVALFGAHFVRRMELELQKQAHAHYALVAARADNETGNVIRALLKEVEGYSAENDYLIEMLERQARGAK